MLRDRISQMRVIDLALKWCKAKENWINHVYDNSINILLSKELRKDTTRNILGISKTNRNFDFHKTISWENLDESEKIYWEVAESWVNWFRKWSLFIEEDIKNGATYDFILKKYCSSLQKDSARLATFLMKHFS